MGEDNIYGGRDPRLEGQCTGGHRRLCYYNCMVIAAHPVFVSVSVFVPAVAYVFVLAQEATDNFADTPNYLVPATQCPIDLANFITFSSLSEQFKYNLGH